MPVKKALINNKVLKGKSKEKALSKPVQFKPKAGQAFDRNNLSYDLEEKTVSIWTVEGRLRKVRFSGSEEQLVLLKVARKGESDLLYDNGVFYLSAGIEVYEKPLIEVTDYLAFDSGIVNIATTSDGDNWSGGAVTACRKRTDVCVKNSKRRARRVPSVC